MQTMIDLFELQEPVVETYRDSYRACVVTPAPRSSVDVSSVDDDVTVRFPVPGHASERRLRARLWGTED